MKRSRRALVALSAALMAMGLAFWGGGQHEAAACGDGPPWLVLALILLLAAVAAVVKILGKDRDKPAR
jgi:hypothetical protein